jgi:hypothetical protein
MIKKKRYSKKIDTSMKSCVGRKQERTSFHLDIKYSKINTYQRSKEKRH